MKVKNNRNETFTSGKELFTNSPIFTDDSGVQLTVTVDGAAYTPLVTLLSEGEHTMTYATVDYKFKVYSNYMYWAARYIRDEISTALKNAKLNPSNVYIYRQDSIQAFPAMMIIPQGMSGNTFKSRTTNVFEYQRNIELECVILTAGTSHEDAQRQGEYIMSILVSYFSDEQKRQLDCFAYDMNFNDFRIGYDESEIKNGLIMYRTSGIINVIKSQIYA